MSRAAPDSLLTLTQSFFLSYLKSTRGASPHTIRAYRDALKLFFQHLAGQKRKPMADLQLEDIQAEAVLTFLDHIESTRRNTAVTRNCRLAAIRSFVQHLLRHDVTRAAQYGRILAIGNKRAIYRAVSYLEPEEARAVIAAVDRVLDAADATMRCYCSFTTRALVSAKSWRCARAIFDWNGPDRCGCWVREGRSGSVRSGRRRPQRCAESLSPTHLANRCFKAAQERH